MGPLTFPKDSQVYLDTAPIIYSGEEHEVFQAIMRDVWLAAKADQIGLMTSSLTLLELLVHPLRHGNARLAEYYEELLAGSSFQMIPISDVVIRRAAEFRAHQNLKTPDAIHAATASLAGCTHFVTNDPTFRRLGDTEVVVLSDLL